MLDFPPIEPHSPKPAIHNVHDSAHNILMQCIMHRYMTLATEHQYGSFSMCIQSNHPRSAADQRTRYQCTQTLGTTKRDLVFSALFLFSTSCPTELCRNIVDYLIAVCLGIYSKFKLHNLIFQNVLLSKKQLFICFLNSDVETIASQTTRNISDVYNMYVTPTDWYRFRSKSFQNDPCDFKELKKLVCVCSGNFHLRNFSVLICLYKKVI